MQKMISELKNLDKDTFKIMRYGLLFCSCLSLIAAAILLTYIFIGSILGILFIIGHLFL